MIVPCVGTPEYRAWRRAASARAVASPVLARLRRDMAPLADLPPAPPVWRWAGPLVDVDPEAERQDLFRTIYQNPIGPPSTSLARAHLVARAIMDETGLTIDQLKSCRRNQKIVRPRQYGMWMLDRYTTWSLEQIGGFFGGKDHTTVLHAVRKVQALDDAGVDLTGWMLTESGADRAAAVAP